MPLRLQNLSIHKGLSTAPAPKVQSRAEAQFLFEQASLATENYNIHWPISPGKEIYVGRADVSIGLPITSAAMLEDNA
jgi:hypothetical protein